MLNITKIPLDVFPQLLRYNSRTGELFWKHRSAKFFNTPNRTPENAAAIWNGRNAGKRAFTATSGGYRVGSIFNIHLLAHHVIWVLLYGEYPVEIDHEDGKRSRNVKSNLRDVSRNQNTKNRALDRRNTSGTPGVRFREDTQKWYARITSFGKTYYLGCYELKRDAIKARKEAELTHNFHSNHGRNQ